MAYDHDAIYKAYPNVVSICDGGSDEKAFIKDENGDDVTINQTLVDAARVELNKLNYQKTRRPLYTSLREFADAMYWNSKGDSTKLTAYYDACEKVKNDNPKP